MFEVRFCPGVAQLRELLRRDSSYTTPPLDCSLLATQLRNLNLSDDQLFISLLFYTRQELWNEKLSLFRALTSSSISLSPAKFIQLVEVLGLHNYYMKVIPYLPLPVWQHLISLLGTHHYDTSRCSAILESIVSSIIDFTPNSDCDHLVMIVHLVVTIGRLSLGTLLDCLAWLTPDSDGAKATDDTNKLVLTGYVMSILKEHMLDCSTIREETAISEHKLVTKQNLYDYIATVISTQYSTDYGELLAASSEELIESLSSADKEGYIRTFCHCYHKLKKRLQVYQQRESLPHTHLGIRGAPSPPESILLMVARIKQSEESLVGSEEFMLYVVSSITAANNVHHRTLVSLNILLYLQNKRVREPLLSSTSNLKWTDEQTTNLLASLKSLCSRAGSQSIPTDQSVLKDDLLKIILEALTRLDSMSRVLRYDYLNDFSPYFDASRCKSMINLSLNKIRPHGGAQQLMVTHTLTALLSINPSEVIKSFTYQILRSKSALAAVMSQVYLSMMQTSMISVEVYEGYISQLMLTDQQTSDLLSKCLLFLDEYDSAVGRYMFSRALDRLSLDNKHLMEMLRNIESVMRPGENSQQRCDTPLVLSLGVFTISVIDSVMMHDSSSDSHSEGNAALCRLSLRLLNTDQISGGLKHMKQDMLQDVLHSLHPNTLSYLHQEEFLQQHQLET